MTPEARRNHNLDAANKAIARGPKKRRRLPWRLLFALSLFAAGWFARGGR
jgi:hypothetical protein